MNKLILTLFLIIFSVYAGCEKDPAPPIYLPSGQTGGGTLWNAQSDGGTDASPEPKKSTVPSSAQIRMIVSTEYAEDRVPEEAPTVTLNKNPRIWIYVFWRGLETNRLYSETIIICPPDKTETCDDGRTLTRDFVPTNTPRTASDAIYVEPLGWMTVTGVNLKNLGAEETLGNWTISVWPTGQDKPSATKILTVM